MQKLIELYFKATLKHPIIILGLCVVLIGGLAFFMQNFRLDASADSLVLEQDKDLKYYRAISARYESDDFIFITFSPKLDLFAQQTLDAIQSLRDKLQTLQRVASVTTILDVPLINSPKMSFGELQQGARTLLSPDTDRQLARKEFTESPLYKNLLVSADGKTTGIQVIFKRDEKYQSLLKQRNALREKQLNKKLTPQESSELQRVSDEFKQYSASLSDAQKQDIANIRDILNGYRDIADIHIGGVPMIVADMIDYIKHDIETFGIGVIAFIIALLAFSFRKPRWVIIPVSICLAVVIGMVGYLGLMEWRVTVVSSNFISLLLIITLSLVVHLIVRYQELHALNPDSSQHDLIKESVRSKFIPSFYTATTTVVAFGSLLVSGIRPVIDFGWMMTVGVTFAFILAFFLLPSASVLLLPGKPVQRRFDPTGHIIEFISRIIVGRSVYTIIIFASIIALSIIGVSRLTVENRFIDYFKETTEIYQGMITIDQKLGGTTPLDVILDPPQEYIDEFMNPENNDDEYQSEQGAGLSGTSYWFNIFQLETVERVHQYLDSLPETGKVLSLATTMKMLTSLNNDDKLDNFSLSIMYNRMPEDVKKTLFNPYMSSDGNQMRFSIRVFESDKNLKRQALLEKIRHDLVEKLELEPQQVHLTGMVVLYNNMLQSLFRSQILTLGVVFLAILAMFLVLFRSVLISLIAILPNITAAGIVLGIMGGLGIPLDIMTITIAAITIGIAVDNSIHYIHRFIAEFEQNHNYWECAKRCHTSIGRAMLYTTIIVTLGFSILSLSNFIPTIYFGLLTGLAMMAALIANLTLLPTLMAVIKPLGKEHTAT